MSDTYPARDPLVNICDPPENQLNYVKRQREAGFEVVLWLGIKQKALMKWYEMKQQAEEFKYIDMLNESIPAKAFKIDRESKRIEDRLAHHVVAAVSKRNELNRKGSLVRRREHENKICKVAILKNDIISIEHWESSLDTLEKRLNEAKDEVCNWRKKYDNLEKEKETLFDEIMSEVLANRNGEQEKLKELQKENDQLVKYIEKGENETLGILPRGAGIPELKSRQAQNRKLKQLKTRAQKALEFVKIFGLDLHFLKLKDPGSSGIFTVDFQDTTKTDVEHDPQQSQYESLSKEDKTTVESILFLMDKFGVSDEFVHELSMVIDDFPIKSYLIKQCRSNLNKQVKITTTPGLAPGAQHSFKLLLAEKVKDMIKEGTIKDGEKVKIKISGDGARMSRMTNFILLSFNILQQVDDILSSKGNHTVAVVNGSESRETLEECFADVFSEVNNVIEEGFITVEGKSVEVEVFLGGDYKFLLLLMGLSAANSTYACLWCKVHKKNRGDMSKPDGFYDLPPMRRTTQELKEFAQKKTGENYCCCHEPLLNIPLDHIILDELHLMLRVTDILLENLIEDAMQWDDKESASTSKKRSIEKSVHIKQLVSLINKCGVTFTIWEKRNADGKGSGTWDWTSLMGDDRKKLLRELPEKLANSTDCIQKNTQHSVVLLWKNFAELYFSYISSWEPFATDTYKKQIKEWIDLFTSLGEKRIGYRKEKVTCYMHAAAFHIPQMVKKNQNIKQFSGQGVEKNNDDARRIIQRKANHSDDPAEVLRTEHRLGVLRHTERKHRKYTKRAAEYWEEVIKTKRGKKRGISYMKVSSAMEESVTCQQSPATIGSTKKTRKTKGNQKKSQNKKKKL